MTVDHIEAETARRPFPEARRPAGAVGVEYARIVVRLKCLTLRKPQSSVELDVRFTPKSGHYLAQLLCPLLAT
jgi:hypothetical protein